MTPTDEIHHHQLRCQPHLLRLRMTAHGDAAALPPQFAAEVAEAVAAVIAEAEAAGRAVGVTAVQGRGATEAGMFLRVRLNRLAVAAEDVIAAARAGNLAAMRRQLHRFDALTSAIWTVQQAVYGRDGARYSGREPLSVPGSGPDAKEPPR